MGNVDLDALYRHFKRYPETFPLGMDMVKGFAEFERNWVERGIFFFPYGGGSSWDIFQKAIENGDFEPERGILWHMDAAGLYGLRQFDTVIVNSNFWTVSTLNTPQVSLAELEAQKACYTVADFFRGHVPGFENAYIVQMGTDLGIRVSRGIEGEMTLTDKETTSSRPVYSDNVIGCTAATANFQETGDFLYAHNYDIPYGIMIPQKTENLIVGSGKSVSCDPQRLIRGMATCMVLGQAAGAAAALAAEREVTPRELDVRSLQRTLLEQGVYLGSKDRIEQLGLQ